jgi:hypothetical protein
VQTTRDFVAVVVELAAGVQHRHDHFGSRYAFLMLVDGDPATVVGHRDGFIGMNGYGNFGAVTGQRLIDRVVDQLEYHVVQTRAIIGIADVHPRPLPYGIESFENLDG